MQLKSHSLDSVVGLNVEMSAKKSSKEPDQQSEFCQKFACDLQTCLDKNRFNPDKCEKVLNKLKQCCLDHGAQSPVVCSGFPTSK